MRELGQGIIWRRGLLRSVRKTGHLASERPTVEIKILRMEEFRDTTVGKVVTLGEGSKHRRVKQSAH